MTSPGVQKPHCTAPSSTKAACTSDRRRVTGVVDRSQPFDGDDPAADRSGGEHQAGAHQLVVDQHRARPALPLLARALGRGQAEPLAQDVEQALAGERVVDRHRSAVHVEAISGARIDDRDLARDAIVDAFGHERSPDLESFAR